MRAGDTLAQAPRSAKTQDTPAAVRLYFAEPKRLGRGSGSAKPGGASIGSCAGGFGFGGVFGGVVAMGTD